MDHDQAELFPEDMDDETRMAILAAWEADAAEERQAVREVVQEAPASERSDQAAQTVEQQQPVPDNGEEEAAPIANDNEGEARRIVRACSRCGVSPLDTDASKCADCWEGPGRIDGVGSRCTICRSHLDLECHKCLRCPNYHLCRWCHEAEATSEAHTPHHPTQCFVSAARAWAGETADTAFEAHTDHKDASRGASSLTCPLCGEVGLTRPGYIDHMTSAHSPDDPTVAMCSLCGREDLAKRPPYMAHFLAVHHSRPKNKPSSITAAVRKRALADLDEPLFEELNNPVMVYYNDGTSKVRYTEAMQSRRREKYEEDLRDRCFDDLVRSGNCEEAVRFHQREEEAAITRRIRDKRSRDAGSARTRDAGCSFSGEDDVTSSDGAAGTSDPTSSLLLMEAIVEDERNQAVADDNNGTAKASVFAGEIVAAALGKAGVRFAEEQ